MTSESRTLSTADILYARNISILVYISVDIEAKIHPTHTHLYRRLRIVSGTFAARLWIGCNMSHVYIEVNYVLRIVFILTC